MHTTPALSVPLPGLREPAEVPPTVVAKGAPEDPAPPPPHLSILREDALAPPRADAVRLLGGAGLASLLGVAIGLRGGAASTLRHALGVPSALLAVCAFAVPSLWVMLSLASVPLAPQRLFRSVSTGVARTGLLLAGFAPAAALFCVSAKGELAAGFGAGGCLAVGAALGLRELIVELQGEAKELAEPQQSVATLALAAFAVLSVALAARVWFAVLPVLHVHP